MIITPKNTFEPNREYAFRIVKDNIINMEIKPGSLIGEQEIATQLGISRRSPTTTATMWPLASRS